MKPRFIFTLLFIAAGTAASAQQQEPVMTRSQFTTLPPVKLSIRPTADTFALKRLLKDHPTNKEWYHEGTSVDSNSLGKGYRMPVDNMLCVVPDAAKNARMPVKKTRMPEPMPNAFSRSRRF